MSERDRYKLLKLLSTSDTPLWLTEHNHLSSELERAADWMTSLGYSARNGFSVHYRELKENELYEPTLVRFVDPPLNYSISEWAEFVNRPPHWASDPSFLIRSWYCKDLEYTTRLCRYQLLQINNECAFPKQARKPSLLFIRCDQSS